MYFTDRGIEELAERRGVEQVGPQWLAARLEEFAELRPDLAGPVRAFAAEAVADAGGEGGDVTLDWLAEELRAFVDLHPEFETPIERLATWLARLDDEDDEDEGAADWDG